MFSLDRWMEVFDTLSRNKLRTALTAISVAWGLFVMVVLLGLGRGLDNGLRYNFRREASNSIWLFASKTSIPYNGYGIGRKLQFENRDYDRATTIKGIDHITGSYFVKGGQFGGGEMLVRHGVKANTFEINSVHPDAIFMGASEIAAGRFLDWQDIALLRKSAVIGKPVADFLFAPGENPIGEWVEIQGVPFQVVGIFTDEGGEEQERQIYIPVSTSQLAYSGVDHLGSLSFTVGDSNSVQAKEITKQVVQQLSDHYQFSPDDPQAVRVHDNVEQYERFSKLFWIISFFVVVIGMGTLAAGVVGVSNIMMIAVKERTKEIGVRKALGATPFSIVAMITQEAIFLTGVAGLLGLSAGVAILGLLGEANLTDFLRNPSIDLRIGVIATLGLILAGALAGYFPARAAARVNPIHALRDQ
jgi:putative ABC transport system permease protein